MTTESAPGLSGWPPPVLDPAGPFAGPIQVVAWVLFIMAAVVMFLTAPRWWMAATGSAIMAITAAWLWCRPEPRQ